MLIKEINIDQRPRERLKRLRAEFQRKYVWEKKPIIKSRLIESAILNVPIPSIYTAEDETVGKELVIDGQQRLLTFHGFINNQFKLKGLSVLKELNGYFYKDLSNLKDENINFLTDKLGDIQELISQRPIRVIKILKESHKLRKESKKLLEKAKKMVEYEIEKEAKK